MASLTDDHNAAAAAAEVCEATEERHNPVLHLQDRRRSPTETQAGPAEPAKQFPLAKQPSLLALTLDEIQNTVCEPAGKSLGSLNIDELLTNIWTIEKGTPLDGGEAMADCLVQPPRAVPDAAAAGTHMPQASLCREGSLTKPPPPPLRRKTVEEVWSEIHREVRQQALLGDDRMQIQHQHDLPDGGVPRHPTTLGEMTLEDFLVKAGVVREGGCPPLCSPPLQQQDGYDFSDGYSRAGCGRNSAPTPGAVCYGDRHNPPTTPANGVYHGAHRSHEQKKRVLFGNDDDHTGVGSPVHSPLSSDGFGAVQAGSSNMGGDGWGGSRTGGGGGAGAVGVPGGAGSNGRKRILDGGPLEKVVERRQRRMMKNRESAARSRARKQAYTVELEKELNFLKEENARLQEEQRRMTARRRQMLLESMAEQPSTEVGLHRNARILRQCSSCVW